MKRTKTSFQTNDGFIFKEVTQEKVRQEIINLDGSKATMYGDMLKSSINIHLDFLTDIIKKSFQDGEFPNIFEI